LSQLCYDRSGRVNEYNKWRAIESERTGKVSTCYK